MLSMKKYTYIFLGTIVILLLYNLTNSTPMTSGEVDEYIEKISHLSHKPGGKHDLTELREFFSSDDGESFYTVNLYKYYEKAQYMNQKTSSLSGREAYERFSSVMVKLLLKNSSYPVFGSNWLDFSKNNWDRIVIVKYRSRRDMANIFSDPVFSLANEDKWASIEKHDRFIVKAMHLPEGYMIVVLLVGIIGSLLFVRKRKG
jgi:hypothetical protein